MALSLTWRHLQDRCMKIDQYQVGHVRLTTISSPAQRSRETLWDGTRITVRDLDPEEVDRAHTCSTGLAGPEPTASLSATCTAR